MYKLHMTDKAKILLYSNNFWAFGEGMLGPLYAVFAEKIGGSILDISWAWSIYLIVTGALVIIIGKISDDRFSKEKLSERRIKVVHYRRKEN